MVALTMTGDLYAAAKKTAGKQSAIQNGTTVRTRVEAKGLYDAECYDAYYSCMDQFCITDNSNGGSCSCSDDSVRLEKEMTEIQSILEEANRISTIEVEKVKAGAKADIIFNGERKYDENGNVLKVDEAAQADKKSKKGVDLSLWANTFDEDDEIEEEIDTIGDKTGAALYSASMKLCEAQVPAKCEKDITFLRQVYSRQITSDCKGWENALATKKASAKQELAKAESDVRAAHKENLETADKYDLGQCMIEFKKCMQTPDACGTGWENCVSTIASENMQNKNTVSTAGTTVGTVDKYDITASTMEILDAKRPMCERVLDQCVSVRNLVWPAFLRESAPTIKLAETQQESKFRQSCLGNISNCIQKACKDDIVGKGTATMDACLSRPDMARSFCKNEIDPCERMEPLIWGYVTDKLAAMRVDACTAEVKECFTAEDRCGKDFINCIGMDYQYIHDICPIDSLVVCKANNPKFAMTDLDSMLMGLYLNIDNAALDNCQELAEKKMMEVCGSTTDCNKFAADDIIGTNSLRSQKDGNVYRVTGMISFGSIKMGDASGIMTDGGTVLAPGQLGVADYISVVNEKNAKVPNKNGIIAAIEEELNNISGTINRTIEMIEQDPEIQYCINGRDLSQITGKQGQKTTARFPNLLTQVKMQIAMAALRQAQTNYNEKLNKEIADATKNASADMAQYICQMLPHNNGQMAGSTNTSTPLMPPYAISYDVGAGLTDEFLASVAGKSTTTFKGASLDSTSANDGNVAEKKGAGIAAVGTLGVSNITATVSNALSSLASDRVKMEIPGGTREMWSLFNRETRVCHYCTSTITKKCNSVSKKGFLGIGAKKSLSCEESEPYEKCEDIPM